MCSNAISKKKKKKLHCFSCTRRQDSALLKEKSNVKGNSNKVKTPLSKGKSNQTQVASTRTLLVHLTYCLSSTALKGDDRNE